MAEASRFVGATPMVAHNAAFDRKFWAARTGTRRAGRAAGLCLQCRCRAASSAQPQARRADQLPGPATGGRAHRALADAEMAAALLAHLQQQLQQRWQLRPDHALPSAATLQQGRRAGLAGAAAGRRAG
jgi:DNA polymerase-3 subunit epsilon